MTAAERNAEDAARAVQRLRVEKDQWHDSAVHAERQLAAAQPKLAAADRVAEAWRALRADPYVCWSLRADVVEALDGLAAVVPPAEEGT